jgi:hypothetical protein
MSRVVARARWATAAAVLAACLGIPSAAPAAPPASCPGAAITPTREITGSFTTASSGSYVMVPFEVPRGTTQVRVKYCWDTPENQAPGGSSHTLDLGLYEPLRGRDKVWGLREFRGWGGSSHRDVAVTPRGFPPAADNSKSFVAGYTSRGFLPGPIKAGRWAVELGVAAVVSRAAGDADGTVGWRVEIELSRDRANASPRYRPARYDTRPARKRPGWYAGDFHVHGEMSSVGNGTFADTFGYAFARPPSGAGLDFVSLTDYVTSAAWGEIGRYQPRYPRKLIIPSAEVITYRGHLGSTGTGRVLDYRTGPIDELEAGGGLRRLRGPRPPSRMFDTIRRSRGVGIINHPRIFPPVTEAAAALCRGCYWSYSDQETDLSKVDAIEVFNSPEELVPGTRNPFNDAALEWWQELLGRGYRVTAVGGSDAHHAGNPTGTFESPVGEPTTMVYARELSGASIKRAVKAGRVYVKTQGVGGPDLSLIARDRRRRGKRATIGQSIAGRKIRIKARVRVLSAGDQRARTLLLQRNGVTVKSIALGPGDTGARITYVARESGRYNLELIRPSGVIDGLTNPIRVTVRPPS